MIVSAQLGTIVAPKPRRGRNFKAVYRTVPGSDVVSAPAPQKPTFNISKGIAKKFIADPHSDKLKYGFVPLKCDQFGTHEEGVALFNAPVYLVEASLDVPKEKESGFAKAIGDIYEDIDVPFTTGLDYKAGIRPSHVQRLLKADKVAEPVNPFPDRPGGVGARPTFQKTTYDVGKLSLEMLRG